MIAKAWALLALLLFGFTQPLELVSTPTQVANTWQVKGKDSIEWTAKLVFLEEADAGYFEWKSADGASGREPFTYTFDEKTRRIFIQGQKIIDPEGNITHAQYTATLSKDGKRLLRGRWFGPGVMPGTWSAVRKKD